MVHTVPEQELNISKKMTTMETWTFYSRRLFLFARLSYYFIAVLRLTKSSTLLSAFGQHSANYLVVIENVTDTFFPKMGTFGTVCDLLCHLPSVTHGGFQLTGSDDFLSLTGGSN